MGWFKKPCSHHNHHTIFNDLHTGGGGEVYVRGSIVCHDCGHQNSFAARVPDAVGAVICENIHFGTYKRKETPEREQMVKALGNVYHGIDQPALMKDIMVAVRGHIKKSFNKL